MNKAPREKSVGEMDGAELKAALFALSGMREPKDPAQTAAFTVARAFVVAMRGFGDRDLTEKFLIDLHLGHANAEQAAIYQPLVEAAIGRRLEPDEPRRYPLSELCAEYARRQQKEYLFD